MASHQGRSFGTRAGHRPASESGVFVLLGAALVLLLLGIAALVVDIGRLEYTVEELQAAADAAALAGSSELDGTDQGWHRAEFAMRHALEVNSVAGAPAATFADENIKIQRGVYWYDGYDGEEQMAFKSLEVNYEEEELYFGASIPSIAHAVQVELTLPSWTAMFANLRREDLTRRATAVANKHLKQCVLPLAVPVCHLLERQSQSASEGNSPENWVDQKFDAAAQSQRELLFYEAAPILAPLRYEQRGKGLLRHELYPARPTVAFTGPSEVCGVTAAGSYENCRAEPIHGILGVHTDFGGDAGSPASPAEVREFLLGASGCADVRLGARFRPLWDGVDSADGLLRDASTSDEIGEAVAAMINNGSKSFTEAFGDARAGSARVNYPYLRYGSSSATGPDLLDRVYRWLPYWTSPPNSREHRMLLGDMARGPLDATGTEGAFIGPWTYTSPLCHDARIPADDPDNAKVFEGVAMLIGSESDEYCDLYNQLHRQMMNTSAVYSATEPRVVGFVKVYLYDFNFADLNAMFPDNTARFPRPTVGMDLVDKNPRGISVRWSE